MLPLRDFDTLVAGMAAAVQGVCRQLIDLTVGSVLRSILEANASVALWIQWLILRVLQTTRAATCTGADLDSWVADFGVLRLPGTAASGVATFGRWTPLSPAIIPIGALLRSGDGKQTFLVTEDTTNPHWSASDVGYRLEIGTATIDVPITATAVGQAGNVLPGTIALLATALPGVDTVTNAAPLAGGADAESDAALRARFTIYLDSRNRATLVAVQSAIISTRQGLRWAVTENQDPSGAIRPGFFTVALDDGSGSASPDLLNQVAEAIDAVRPVGTSFSVVPPAVQSVDVSLTLSILAGAPDAVVRANVTTAIEIFIDSLPIGAGLPATRLVQVAYDADAAVRNVAGLILNGESTDLAVPPTGLLRTRSVTVS